MQFNTLLLMRQVFYKMRLLLNSKYNIIICQTLVILKRSV